MPAIPGRLGDHTGHSTVIVYYITRAEQTEAGVLSRRGWRRGCVCVGGGEGGAVIKSFVKLVRVPESAVTEACILNLR